MKFAIHGLVRWKHVKIANGIDGIFETDSEKIITRLRTLGFQTIDENEKEKERCAEILRLHQEEVEKAREKEEVEIATQVENEIITDTQKPKQSVYRRKQR